MPCNFTLIFHYSIIITSSESHIKNDIYDSSLRNNINNLLAI